MKAFIEFGTGNYADLLPLLNDDWKDKVHKYSDFGGERFKDYTDTWFGIFVEPMPHCIIEMLNRLHSHGIDGYRYMFFAGIVAGETKPTKVYSGSGVRVFTNPFDVLRVGSSIINRWPHHERYIYVNAITLDDLIDISPYPVDLLRVDCEGAELEIFKSFSFDQCPRHVIVETHDRIINGIEKGLLDIFDKQGRPAEIVKPENDVPYLVSIV